MLDIYYYIWLYLNLMILNCLDIIITNRCNLKCSYCEIPQIHSKDQEGFIKKETAFEAIDSFLKTTNKKVVIHFFGGEPLLNFSLIKEICEYAKNKAKKLSKKLTLSIAINGTLITEEVAEYIIKNNFNILYSIDGNEEIHNLNRPFANGKSSYEIIIDHAKLLLKNIKRKEKIFARATLTSNELDIEKITLSLVEIGFKYIQVEPAFAPETSLSIIKEEHIQTIKENLINFAKNYPELFKKEPFIFLPMGYFIFIVMNGSFKNYMCEYGKTAVVLNTDGKVYPCYRFTHISSFGSEISKMHSSEKLQPFCDRTSDTIKLCSTCWLKYYCGGTCYHHSYIYHNDLYIPYYLDCKYIEELFKASILTYSIFNKNDIKKFMDMSYAFYNKK